MRTPGIVRWIVLSTAMAILLSHPALADPTHADRNQGLELYKAHRYAEAIPYFDRVLERHRRDMEVRLKRGACFVATDQPEKALADFDWVNGYSAHVAGAFQGAFNETTAGITLPSPDPWYPEAFGNRGIALLMLGRDQEALESFQQAVALWNRWYNIPHFNLSGMAGGWPPNRSGEMRHGRAAAYQGLGQAYHRLGQAPAAIEAYNTAISIYPADANSYVGRGDVLLERKLIAEAIADYDRAIQMDPTHSRGYASRGIAHYLQGENEKAVADLDQAIAIDPNYAKAYSYRGAAHARLGQNELALKDYDAVIRLMPEFAGGYKDRGGVLYRLGRYDSALRDLDRAIQLDPRKGKAYQNRGAVQTALGQYERAIADYDRALELDDKNAGAYTNRGRAHFAIGHYDQAIADLSEAIQLEPKNPITRYNRAEVFLRLGMNERALEDYSATVEIAPKMAPAYAAIGRIQAQLGHRDEAIRDFDMALRLDPKGAGVAVYQDRGNVRREGGDWAGALSDYDQAIALDPRRAELYVARGWARLGSGAEWADNDARAYLMLKGWRDPFSPYMGLLAILGARGTPREAEARRLLDEAVVNTPRGQWPDPVLRYFHGDIDANTLLASARSQRHLAEVHAFLGLEAIRTQNPAAARPHLEYARDHGAPGSIAADVARAALTRLP